MASRFTRLLRSVLFAAVMALAVVPGAARAANPSAPTVFTGGIAEVTRSSAVLTGSADPRGGETTVHFEYGTTKSYGLKTPSVGIAAFGAVNFHVPIKGLTAGTTYHVRLVASNAAGVTRGADRAFATAAPPKAPYVQTRSVTGIIPTGAALVARVNPRGQPTTVSFEYGTTSKYGSSTGITTVPAGDKTVFVSIPLTGLAAGTKYHYRAVAWNATGVRRGNRHSFRTTRGISDVSLKLGTRHVEWSERAFLGGEVGGLNPGGVTVTLWQRDHPFTGDFRPVATTKTTSLGTFGFTTDKLYWATQFRVTTNSAQVATSRTVETLGDLYTKLRIASRHRREVQLRGLAYPAVDGAQVTIQRKTPKGRWITARTTTLESIATGNRSGFRVWVPRLSARSARYRAVIEPPAADGGAHAATRTKSVLAPRRK